jgi:hypothetical protein
MHDCNRPTIDRVTRAASALAWDWPEHRVPKPLVPQHLVTDLACLRNAWQSRSYVRSRDKAMPAATARFNESTRRLIGIRTR